MSHLEAAFSWSGCWTWHRCQRMEHPVAVLQWVQKIEPSSPLSHTCSSEPQSHLRNYKNHSINNMQTFKSRPNGLVSILFCFRRISWKNVINSIWDHLRGNRVKMWLHTSKRALMTVNGSMHTPATALAPAPSSMASATFGAWSWKKCCFRE